MSEYKETYEIPPSEFEEVYKIMLNATVGENNYVVISAISRLLNDIADSSNTTISEILEILEEQQYEYTQT